MVCRLWSHLIRDKYLWQYVDLTSNPIPPKTLWKVIRGYLSDSLRSLSLHGFLYSVKKTDCLSHALLEELSSRCPKLTCILIQCANLTMIKSHKFPRNLKRLYIVHCEVTPHWLKSAVEENRLKSMEELSFCDSKRFSDIDIDYVSKLTNLKLLNLNNCYRITDEAVNKLTNSLLGLKTLILSGCSITDLSIHFVSHRLKNIQTLDISRCTTLTNSSLAILGFPYCPRFLKVQGCNCLLVQDLAKVVKANSGLISIEFKEDDEIKFLTQANFDSFLKNSEEQEQQE
ncbi:F-box/LRR-repeat protein 12-like isoform X2 [Anneissia japonica]|uniref:F-box/LRR-repeat protein 12-like isoform X2 n=1 Tax=Anneissia japonica TaxID=1529436 RepID=UPI0014259330|nr:F-box/LRR-repeat protein 12-like isoform X2 [Anneissia japonica]